MTSFNALHLHPRDNICIVTGPLEAGALVSLGDLEIRVDQEVPIGHKIALIKIAKGEPIRKYGQTIGFTTAEVRPGEWVHSHNLENGTITLDYASASDIPPAPEPLVEYSFDGYRRASGKAGTRNYLAVISNVNCSATVAKYIAERFDESVLSQYPNIDGVVAFKHGTGCGMQFGSLKHDMLNRVMGGIARHANIGGFLLVGLGCEQATTGYLIAQEQLVQIDGIGSNIESNAPIVLSMQDLGGTMKTVDEGVRRITEMLPRVNAVSRESIPASELILGTECGGSDGNSGVTANPAVGVASDMLVAAGGTTILAETTEIFGAEHLLTRRAVSKKVADKLIDRITWWQEYTSHYGAKLDNNPSVGNKAGGLTTITEKSLGAVAKAGRTALVDVYHYAEQVTAKGMVVMDTPGYDPPSVTGMVAGGANVVVFTTGRGSCYGCKPVPSIKIASNTPMFERMEDDMDINAGQILDGRSIEEVGRDIFDEILATASGKLTKSEEQGIGDEEFMPWLVGPTL